MSLDIDASVAEIDQAVFQLRHLWAKAQLLQHLREQCGPGRPIQLSSVFVVHAIARHGDEPGDVTIGAVAEYLDVDPSTASRLVGQAIDAGFVSRRPSPVDGRRAHLLLTDAGRQVKEMTDEFRRRFIKELLSGWTDDERTQFALLLGRFAQAAARLSGAPPSEAEALASARPGFD